eukprot:3433605-Amphidinium_carterae.1
MPQSISGWLIVHPFDVAKVQMQINQEPGATLASTCRSPDDAEDSPNFTTTCLCSWLAFSARALGLWGSGPSEDNGRIRWYSGTLCWAELCHLAAGNIHHLQNGIV